MTARLDDFEEPDLTYSQAHGFCCALPSCDFLTHNYVRCCRCGKECFGCVRDRPEKRGFIVRRP